MYDDHVGVLRAMNPLTGDIEWEHKEKMPLWAGVLTTKGGLVFTGTGDGFLKAFDAETGEELWKFQTGSGIISPRSEERRVGKESRSRWMQEHKKKKRKKKQ